MGEKLKLTIGILLIYAFFSFYCIWASAEDQHENIIISSTLETINQCLYWPGEEAYDEVRTEEINAGIKKDCRAAQAEAEDAYQQYPHNQLLAGPIIELLDLGYFHIRHENIKQLCHRAEPYFKDWEREWKTANPAYWMRCKNIPATNKTRLNNK